MSKSQIAAIILTGTLLITVLVLLSKRLIDIEKKDYKKPSQSYCGDNFTVVSDSDDLNEGFIVYDNDTKVMYYVSTDNGNYAGNYGTMTLLVNADGSPKLYEDDDMSAS